jgi:D-alanine-D-alanine ligase
MSHNFTLIPKDRLKVAIIIGSTSGELEVSQKTGENMYQAMVEKGYTSAYKLEFVNEDDLLAKIKLNRPDVVLNATLGIPGEDGTVPIILDYMQIPYTHAGATGSRIGMDKALSKKIFPLIGVPTARYITVNKSELLSDEYIDKLTAANIIQDKLVIKPTQSGSSIGVMAFNVSEKPNWHTKLDTNYPEYLIEEYNSGRQFDVLVLGEKATIIERIFDGEICTYDDKYTPGRTNNNVDYQLSATVQEKLKGYAIAIHKRLDCKSISRSEFIVNEGSENIVAIEVNTHPAMTNTSMSITGAAALGMSKADMVEFILLEANYNIR